MTTGVVYVVDGDESVRAGLGRLVESAGLQPRLCGCVADLLQQAHGGKGCALLDLSSAGLREPSLWSQVLALAATLPVIALSARDDSRTRRTARKLGAQAFFRKPVDGAALLDSIDWVMRAERQDLT